MYLLLKRQYIRKLKILECQKIGWSFAFEEVLLPKHISISSAVLPNDVQENYHCHPTPARSLWCVFHQRWQWLHFSPESWLFHVLPQPRKWCVSETSSRVRNISFFIFPLLLLIPLYKCRKSRLDDEICFGFIVFFENYKEKYWFWEIVEMYRKLIPHLSHPSVWFQKPISNWLCRNFCKCIRNFSHHGPTHKRQIRGSITSLNALDNILQCLPRCNIFTAHHFPESNRKRIHFCVSEQRRGVNCCG